MLPRRRRERNNLKEIREGGKKLLKNMELKGPEKDEGDTLEGRGPSASTLAAFAAVVIIAGGNPVAIRYVSCASCELAPFWAAATRFLLAGAIFAAVAIVLRVPLPSGRAIFGATVYGALQFGAGLGFVYWGLVRAPAGHGQVLLATVPLLTFLLALVQRQEEFSWGGLAGAALAVMGIAVIFQSGLHSGVPVTSLLSILAGAFCYAEALIVVKKTQPISPAALNAIGMGVGAVILLALSVIYGESYSIPTNATTWWAQSYLVIAGSVGVFWLYVIVLRGWTASAAAYELVLIPLVTVGLSAWLQGEHFAWSFAAGVILVLAGVYIGALRRPTFHPGHSRHPRI